MNNCVFSERGSGVFPRSVFCADGKISNSVKVCAVALLAFAAIGASMALSPEFASHFSLNESVGAIVGAGIAGMSGVGLVSFALLLCKKSWKKRAKQRAVDQISEQLRRGEVVEYMKGAYKTRFLMGSCEKCILGEGENGRVVAYGEDSDYAVKKTHSSEGMRYEHWIGRKLLEDPRCPDNFLRVYGLAVKQGYDRGLDKQRMLMEKIKGVSFAEYQRKLVETNAHLDPNSICDLLQQAARCCAYLHEKDICWDDVHHSNLMVEEKEASLHLRVIDYGRWIYRSHFIPDEETTDCFQVFAENAVRAAVVILNCARVDPLKFEAAASLEIGKPEEMGNREQERKLLEAYFEKVMEIVKGPTA